MLRVKIIKNGIQTHGAQFNTQAEADAWIAEGSKQQWWGKPAYTEVVPAVKEIREVVVQPRIVEQREVVIRPEEKDADGNIIAPTITEIQEVVIQEEIKQMQEVVVSPETTIEHPAEFEVQIEDITAEIEAQKVVDQALKFLSDTDWLVLLQVETGEPVPTEILQQRATARALIKENKDKIRR
jgi:hypothetical protein